MKEQNKAHRQRVLDNIRVIDFTHVLAGPYCTRILCDLGAEVIKIEPVVIGEGARASNMHYWWFCNCGKKSLSINITKPDGKQIIQELVKKADVIIDNFTVGTMAKLGLSYESLKDINPRLIGCSITGFGQYGPLRDMPALNAVASALSGLTWWQGQISRDDGKPTNIGYLFADITTGIEASLAICAALYFRQITGKGQYIDISLLDVILTTNDRLQRFLLDEQSVDYLQSKQSGRQIYADYMIHPTGDGYIVLEPATTQQWEKLAEVMGNSVLLKEERFNSAINRTRNMKELKEIIDAWTSKFKTKQEILAILEKAGIVCAPILTFEEAVRLPHVTSRDIIANVQDFERGLIKVLNTPYKFSNTDAGIRGRLPRLGEHNNEVLATMLGYSKERIKELY